MKKVITYGTFDLFHEGHLKLLQRAKALGDYLIVGITTEHYDLQRGKLGVVNPILKRIQDVQATGLVDEIIIEDHAGQKLEDIQRYGIDIFTVGSDWVGAFDYLKDYCEVIYLERTPSISSTQIREEKYQTVRLGIVGSGRIAPRFLGECKYVSGIQAAAVYNPKKNSAISFGEKYSLQPFFGEFSEFLEDLEAIYIASPHQTHYDYAKQAILAGRHVLCEKPLTFSVAEAEELYGLAKEKGVVLMEAIKTAYCPGFTQLINVAKSGVIGEICDVEACFSRIVKPGVRELVDEAYGGAFLEYGSYTMLPIFKLLGCDYKDVRIDSICGDNGVDLYSKISFRYAKGLALSKTGVAVKSEGQLIVAGTKGYILAQSPWWLTKGFEVRFEDPNKIERFTPKFLGDGLRYEISDFVKQVRRGEGESFYLTREESIAMAGVVERFMELRQNK